MEHISPKIYYEIVQSHPRKYMGQNFLVDHNVIQKIAEVAELKDDDTILEIGPGFGILTQCLADNVSEITAIEKDTLLFNYLKGNLKAYDNLKLINADFLEVDLIRIIKNKKIKVVSNLPYSVASQIIFKLLESGVEIDRMILMVQKEMGERICSRPNNKSYGAFTVLVQSYMNCKIKFRVSPNSFWPKPNVDSVVIEFVPRAQVLLNSEERIFFNKVVKSAFHSRRKKMINNLKALADIEKLKFVFNKLNLDENVRAEMLSLSDFVKLTRALINENYEVD